MEPRLYRVIHSLPPIRLYRKQEVKKMAKADDRRRARTAGSHRCNLATHRLSARQKNQSCAYFTTYIVGTLYGDLPDKNTGASKP